MMSEQAVAGGRNAVDADSRLPKSIQCLRNYTAATFASDLIAGITVGLVALPLAMAFAISSGLQPQAGIYCAILTGFLISALGGSACQIGGPTGAFVVVVAGIVSKHGVDGLYICTLLAGAMIALLGLTGLGNAVKFLPRSVIVGFTNGIAILIASTQIRDFLGIQIEHVPSEFVPRLVALAQHVGSVNYSALGIACGALATILIVSRLSKRIPGTILAMVGGTAVVALLHLNVETIGSRFGGIPSGLPHFAAPQLSLSLITPLLLPAVTVAMLGAIESLMSATVADRMSGDRHNPNVELVAQGVANMVSPLFGGLPATGALARTATNIRSGAKTPIAGMIHALTLVAVLLFAAPLAKLIPLCILAAILFVVAYNMGEWHEIPAILKLSKADISVWLVTLSLTVFADLTVAVMVGMILAALLFIRKVTATTTVSLVTEDYIADSQVHTLQGKDIPEYVSIYRIHGPFLFGATDKLEEITAKLASLPSIVILRLRNMTAIDGTGLQALEDLADALKASNRSLILCGAREQPARLMAQAEFARHIGKENLCEHVEQALERARVIQLGSYGVKT